MIPKPDGSQRELGIPTVTDRLIQQALLQVLQPLIDPTFSEHSHGFRPGRRAQDAVKAARCNVQQGKRVVVDVDLSKFFDRVNHDIQFKNDETGASVDAPRAMLKMDWRCTHPRKGKAMNRHWSPSAKPASMPLTANTQTAIELPARRGDSAM